MCIYVHVMYVRMYCMCSYVCVTPSIFHVAFTELQTDMELVYDRSDQHLPFLDFRTFAMRVLFPHDTEHVVLQPLTVSGPSGGGGLRDGIRCILCVRWYVCGLVWM